MERFNMYSREIISTGSKEAHQWLHATHCLDLICLPIIYHTKCSELLNTLVFPFTILIREILNTLTWNKGQQVYVLLHITHHIALMYMPTTYHQNISTWIRVVKHTRFQFKILSRKIIKTGSKWAQPWCLHMTHHRDLMCMATKYLKGLKRKWTRKLSLSSFAKGGNSKYIWGGGNH